MTNKMPPWWKSGAKTKTAQAARMFQDRYETYREFEEILKPTKDIDPTLVEIDRLLEDDELYQCSVVKGIYR